MLVTLPPLEAGVRQYSGANQIDEEVRRAFGSSTKRVFSRLPNGSGFSCNEQR